MDDPASTVAQPSGPLFTPDGRYLVVRGRLWRTSDPRLSETERSALVKELKAARGAVKRALVSGNAPNLKAARQAVHVAKTALGERGPVWWDDAAPDYTRTLAKNSPYAYWYAEQAGG